MAINKKLKIRTGARSIEREPSMAVLLPRLVLDDLARSGLTREDARQLGIHVPALKGYGGALRYRIPYWTLKGNPTRHYRDRFLGAMGSDGDLIRYRGPSGEPPQLYFPHIADTDWQRIASDPKVALIVTEGEKKSAAATKAGFPTVGLGGVWCWMREHQPIRDFDLIEWKGRCVTIAFDSDAATKADVRTAEARLAQELQARGAEAYIARLPASKTGEKQGVDDLLVVGGPDALKELLDTAEKVTPAAVNPTSEDEEMGPNVTRRPPAKARKSMEVMLPSGRLPYIEAAGDIFQRLADKEAMFCRGEAIMELVPAKSGGKQLALVTPDSFRSRVEALGSTWTETLTKEGKISCRESRLTVDSAKALLATREARELLPHIRALVAQPVLAETHERLVTLGPGYHAGPEILVLGKSQPQFMFPQMAVRELLNLLRDFEFVSDGDKARAIASLITPSMVFARLIEGPHPLEVAESDRSQAGKGWMQQLPRLIHGDHAYLITRRQGGVGSLDESISQGLLSGKAFVAIDNLRDRIASQHLEAIITWPDRVSIRVPHKGEVQLDATGVIFQLTSNGMMSTTDLANRSSIVRIRKQPDTYRWHKWPEGDLLAHVRANQRRYLGAVHAVVKAWHKQGAKRSSGVEHDFKPWADALDWIVQEFFETGSLMAEHRDAQERISNPAMAWLREVALAVRKTNQLGKALTTQHIFNLCSLHDVELPSVNREIDETSAVAIVGRLLGKVFKETAEVVIDELRITRRLTHRRDTSRKLVEVKQYVFETAE